MSQSGKGEAGRIHGWLEPPVGLHNIVGQDFARDRPAPPGRPPG